MGGNTTVIWIVAGLFLIVAVVSAIIWWSLADRIYPGASKSTGQYIDLTSPEGKKRHASHSDGGPIVIGDSGALAIDNAHTSAHHHGHDHHGTHHGHDASFDASGSHGSGAADSGHAGGSDFGGGDAGGGDAGGGDGGGH